MTTSARQDDARRRFYEPLTILHELHNTERKRFGRLQRIREQVQAETDQQNGDARLRRFLDYLAQICMSETGFRTITTVTVAQNGVNRRPDYIFITQSCWGRGCRDMSAYVEGVLRRFAGFDRRSEEEKMKIRRGALLEILRKNGARVGNYVGKVQEPVEHLARLKRTATSNKPCKSS